MGAAHPIQAPVPGRQVKQNAYEITVGLSQSSGGYLIAVADLLLALIVVVLAVAGAELVRITCRRQLLTPVGMTRVPAGTAVDLE